MGRVDEAQQTFEAAGKTEEWEEFHQLLEPIKKS
jgi:hypothetical protein